jgi:hypothetical protein
MFAYRAAHARFVVSFMSAAFVVDKGASDKLESCSIMACCLYVP